jgi:hypothetical protein
MMTGRLSFHASSRKKLEAIPASYHLPDGAWNLFVQILQNMFLKYIYFRAWPERLDGMTAGEKREQRKEEGWPGRLLLEYDSRVPARGVAAWALTT